MTPAAQPAHQENQGIKLALDLGPLLLFFGAYNWYNIYVATGTLMAATIISLGIGYWLNRRIALMPLVTCIVVTVFGGLTLLFQNDVFIKVKPTIIYGIFASILFIGLALGRPFLRNVFQLGIHLTDEGWRVLTFRFASFFVFLAVLNEIVWRNFSMDVWVNFKVWGFLPLTVIFMAVMIAMILKYEIKDEPKTGDDAPVPTGAAALPSGFQTERSHSSPQPLDAGQAPSARSETPTPPTAHPHG